MAVEGNGQNYTNWTCTHILYKKDLVQAIVYYIERREYPALNIPHTKLEIPLFKTIHEAPPKKYHKMSLEEHNGDMEHMSSMPFLHFRSTRLVLPESCTLGARIQKLHRVLGTCVQYCPEHCIMRVRARVSNYFCYLESNKTDFSSLRICSIPFIYLKYSCRLIS